MSLKAAIVSVMAAVALAGNVHDRAFYEAKFFNWLATYNVKPASGEHFVRMLQNFADNEDIIAAHNARNESYTLGHNKFSHLSLEEWRQQMNFGLARPQELEAPLKIHEAPAGVTLPASVDWVTAGAVTGVKDQGQCGSCWSFSTTGALEGAHKIKHNELLSLSEQHLVDCDTRKNGGTDMGCNGGLMDSAFSWVKNNHGINLEADYVYVSGTTKTAGTCSEKPNKYVTAVTGYVDVKKTDTDLMSAIAQQPVSVAIEADQKSFQLYSGGVFTGTCGTNLDHGVLAVGYGTDAGKDYYKVKNSWGTTWGEKGYIRIQRGADLCGIRDGASYPVIN